MIKDASHLVAEAGACSGEESDRAVAVSADHENLSAKWNQGVSSLGAQEAREVRWLCVDQLRDSLQRTHPAANVFCRCGADVKRLAESLLRDGPQHPIVFVDDMLIDGRTRLEAALEANCCLPAIYYSEEELGERTPFEFALASNCASTCVRRMTETQIALACVKNDQDEIEAERAAARDRQRRGVKLDPADKGTTRQRLAAKYHVSASRLRKAEAVIESGDADLYARCFRGELSLNKAYLQVQRDSSADTPAVGDEARVGSQAETESGRPSAPELIATLPEVIKMIQAIAGQLKKLNAFNPGATVDASLLQAFVDELGASVERAMRAQPQPQSHMANH